MSDIRSIVVIDVGATNTRVVQFRPDLTIAAVRSAPARIERDGPYPSIDVDAVLDLVAKALPEFDARLPVDAVVPCCHGSALALLDADGSLALPVMSYMADMPADVAQAYAAMAPPFDEALCPTNPASLTLGRQLLRQRLHWPDAFATVRTILPLPQYVAYRLSGVAASEVSSLGAQTHLWAPRARAFSSLAVEQGWDRLFAPIRHARDVLGPVRGLSLNGRAEVLCGVHDSNANFHGYGGDRGFCLLSTGTWIIAFDGSASLDALDGRLDQVSNTTVSGEPVACARFMGGQEYARAIEGFSDAVPSINAVRDLTCEGIMALPSFTESGGPVPSRSGRGRIEGGSVGSAERAASLASLYTAQMTSVMLDSLGTAQNVVVDGVFASNDVFMGCLAALSPARTVRRSFETQGTARGAALLALPIRSRAAEPRQEIARPALVDGLSAYHRTWMDRIDAG